MNEEKLRKIYEGKSRAEAVKLFCRECMGYSYHRNGWKGVSYQEASRRVKECEDKKCPLWKYRL